MVLMMLEDARVPPSSATDAPTAQYRAGEAEPDRQSLTPISHLARASELLLCELPVCLLLLVLAGPTKFCPRFQRRGGPRPVSPRTCPDLVAVTMPIQIEGLSRSRRKPEPERVGVLVCSWIADTSVMTDDRPTTGEVGPGLSDTSSTCDIMLYGCGSLIDFTSTGRRSMQGMDRDR